MFRELFFPASKEADVTHARLVLQQERVASILSDPSDNGPEDRRAVVEQLFQELAKDA